MKFKRSEEIVNTNYSINEIYNAILEKISKEVREASDNNQKLFELIEKYNLFGNKESYHYDKLNAKILFVGDMDISLDILYAIAKKEFDITRDRIKTLDYQEAKHFDFQLLKGYSEYTDIIVGPNAHKAIGIDGYNSLISMLKAEQDNFPLLTEATDSTGKLKFTKTSIRKALSQTKLVTII